MEITKGPWHYQEESDAYTHIIRGPNGEFVGSAPQGSKGSDEANARLMAAAPELLKVLKAIATVNWREWEDGLNTHENFVAWARSIAAYAASTTESKSVTSSPEQEEETK